MGSVPPEVGARWGHRVDCVGQNAFASSVMAQQACQLRHKHVDACALFFCLVPKVSRQPAARHTLPTSHFHFPQLLPFLLTPEIETFQWIKFKAFLQNLIAIIDFAAVSTENGCLSRCCRAFAGLRSGVY